tara:strand:- start:124 stop:792 length:669 start_codon:yes stop_codon:yes gene_type:complete
MSFVLLGVAVVGGAAKIYSASQGKKARIAEQDAANQELSERKAEYENMDTSNPYADLENVYEDLTVNTQQAEMMNQQTQQNQANIMQGMNQAAGGSGVAGMAQAMANTGQQQAQKASASIGQQEQTNQKAMLGQEASLQSMEAQGDRESQRLEMGKTETMFGMSQQRKISADAARQRATDQMVSGIGDIAGGVAATGQTALTSVQAGKSWNENLGINAWEKK